MTLSTNPFAYRKPITLDSLPDLFAHHSRHLAGWRMDAGADAGGDASGSAGSGDGGGPGDGANGGDTYKPPASQADLDRIVGERLARERAKYGGLTPEQLTELREKAARQDALEHELSTDRENAVRETRTTVEQEQAAKYQPLLAETAFRVSIEARNAQLPEAERKSASEIDDFLADLNLSRFVTEGGKVDTAKVFARAEQFAPAKTADRGRRGPEMPGAGSSGSGKAGSGLSGLDGNALYDRLHPKKTA